MQMTNFIPKLIILGVELDNRKLELEGKGPFQIKLFYDSIILKPNI